MRRVKELEPRKLLLYYELAYQCAHCEINFQILPVQRDRRTEKE